MHDTPESPEPLERGTRGRQNWIDRGFDPDQEITEYFGCFTLKEAKRSLFKSNHSNPIPVFLTQGDDGEVRIPLVIDTARCDYAGRNENEDYPNWYFEGWRVPTGYATSGVVSIRRIRIYVMTLTREFTDEDMFEWQYIPANEVVSSA